MELLSDTTPGGRLGGSTAFRCPGHFSQYAVEQRGCTRSMATALSPGASLSPRGWAVVGLLGLIVGVFAAVANPVVGALVIVAALGLLGSAYAPGLVLAAYLFVGFYKGALQAYSPVDLTVLLALMSGLQ